MHEYDTQHKKGLYRSRSGILAGVCKGIAEQLGFSPWLLRIVVLIIALMTSVIPVVVAYLIVALLMKPEPLVPFEGGSQQEFYDSYVSSRSLAIDRLKRTYDSLDRRIRRMESIVTSRDFVWDRRLGK